MKGNYSIDYNGQFYSTTKVYGYIKRANCPLSYEFLLALLNSSLFWFFIKNTGYVLRGGYYTFKTNYITPFPLPNYEDIEKNDIRKIEDIVHTIHAKRRLCKTSDISDEMVKIDGIISKIYSVEIDDIIC